MLGADLAVVFADGEGIIGTWQAILAGLPPEVLKKHEQNRTLSISFLFFHPTTSIWIGWLLGGTSRIRTSQALAAAAAPG